MERCVVFESEVGLALSKVMGNRAARPDKTETLIILYHFMIDIVLEYTTVTKYQKT